MDLSDLPPFDVIVLDCGLPESIAAASLAHAGLNVLHVDENENYGGDYASLTVSELTAWAEQRSSPSSGPPTTYLSSQRSRFSQIEVSSPTPPVLAKQRAFSLSLSPLLIPSLSPLIQTLIDSGTSRYSTFRLLESSSIYARDAEGEGPGKATKVPGCKEDVFTDKAIGLVDKRRLMKVLMWCAGEFEESKEILGCEQMPFLDFLKTKFSLSAPLAEAFAFALAQCSSAEDSTLPSLVRAKSYLRSLGKFGSSAFLLGQYGGAGEIAQGFCRLSAVQGAVYVLSHPIESLDISTGDDRPISLQIKGFTHAITASDLVYSPDYLPPSPSMHPPVSVARAIAILDHYPSLFPRDPPSPSVAKKEAPEAIWKEAPSPPDTATMVFPPHSVVPELDVAVQALLMGEGTGSCPEGYYVLYLTCSSPSAPSSSASPASLFAPFLSVITSSPPSFLATYHERLSPPASASAHPASHAVHGPPTATALVTEESARVEAEAKRLFEVVWSRAQARRRKGQVGDGDGDERGSKGFFRPAADLGEGGEDVRGDEDEWQLP